MNATAVTVSRTPAPRLLPGMECVNFVAGELRTAADVQAAWFAALELVRTPWCFFLDDDDDLPPHGLAIVDRCIAAGCDLAYTDELVVDGSTAHHVRRGRPYLQSEHLADPMLVHHLAVMRTSAARAAMNRLPRGHFWPELLLFWELAKGGAHYQPEVGYLWRRAPNGLSRRWWTTVAVSRSQLWCKANP